MVRVWNESPQVQRLIRGRSSLMALSGVDCWRPQEATDDVHKSFVNVKKKKSTWNYRDESCFGDKFYVRFAHTTIAADHNFQITRVPRPLTRWYLWNFLLRKIRVLCLLPGGHVFLRVCNILPGMNEKRCTERRAINKLVDASTYGHALVSPKMGDFTRTLALEWPNE